MLKTNLMKEYIFVEEVQALGLVVSDKMYLMSLVGQSFTKFGGHHTGSSESGVAYYSYAHIE
jgi:hypothetical protein